MTLIYLTLALAAGITLARQWGLGAAGLAELSGAGLLVAAWGVRSARGRLAGALLIAALVGGWRYWLAQPAPTPRTLAYYNDRGQTTVRGHVSAEPSVRGTYTQLELAIQELEQQGARQPVRGKAILNVPHYPEFAYGDALVASGLLETPPELDGFDYREYLATRGVGSVLRRAQVQALGERRGNPLLCALFGIKRALRASIEAILPNPDAGLLGGILLGLGHTLPDDLAEAFRAAGLTHIIVVSGFNISLVSQYVLFASRRMLHRWLALLISLGAVTLFALLVGPSPPVARATLMGCLAILAQLVGRRSHALTSLAAASLAMLVGNPLLLRGVSFQLSLASTLGLIVFEPLLAHKLYGWVAGATGDDRPGWLRLARDLLLTTLAAQLVTLPIIWYHFGQVSLIAPLANVLVLPFQPMIMGFGFAAMLAGCISVPLGRAAAWLVWPFLRYTILVIQGLGGLSWASTIVPRVGMGAVGAFYGLLGLCALQPDGPKVWAALRGWFATERVAKVFLLISVALTVSVWAAALTLPDGKLHLYFLDVGQGDAILVRTPGGRTILIDGGADPTLLSARVGQVLPFWQRRIDLVVATHADQDHLGGLVPLVQRYHVERVIESPTMAEGALSAVWHERLASAKVEVLRAARGQRVTVGKALYLDVLHPPPRAARVGAEDGNPNSVVLRLVAGRCRVLLAADIDAQTEASLLTDGQPLSATVLKVSHHGAASGSSAAFLAAVDPRLAVISVGQDNRFGHPSDEALGRLAATGCRVLRTDQHGTIELITDGQALWVRCAKAALH